MILPERFAIHITGTVAKVRTRHMIVPNGLPHLLAELMAGRLVPSSAWEAYGLRLEVEVDTDQCEAA